MIGKEIGPYRILQKLAQGGMCAVYKGVHTNLEQEVAIKILSSEAFDDKSVRDRFINEAKIQARLSHPNVVKTLNYVEQNNTVALVMEYINGETLDVLLKKAGALPVERAAAILESILDAVDFMHSKGIVHRDIKPANIMMSYDGFIKVMDFGIAKVMGDSAKTKTGIRIGTLWYMSPEQIRGTGVTVQSDIYSLGVMFYQMVTGTVPFNGETEFDIMKSHIEDAPAPPWKINNAISKGVGRIILKAMSKNPRDRYPGIREFGAELKAAINPEPATRMMIEPPVNNGHAVWPFHKFFEPMKWRASFSVIIAGFAIALLIAYLFYQSKGQPLTAGSSQQKEVPQVRAAIINKPPPAAEEYAVKADPEVKSSKKAIPVQKKQKVVANSAAGRSNRVIGNDDSPAGKIEYPAIDTRNKKLNERKEKSGDQWRIIK
jgi:serine/threonine protein kinase